jgi:hypothetical protein
MLLFEQETCAKEHFRASKSINPAIPRKKQRAASKTDRS